jgi:hypothetical protein
MPYFLSLRQPESSLPHAPGPLSFPISHMDAKFCPPSSSPPPFFSITCASLHRPFIGYPLDDHPKNTESAVTASTPASHHDLSVFEFTQCLFGFNVMHNGLIDYLIGYLELHAPLHLDCGSFGMYRSSFEDIMLFGFCVAWIHSGLGSYTSRSGHRASWMPV